MNDVEGEGGRYSGAHVVEVEVEVTRGPVSRAAC